jgi:REP element-mobilizing transposase RayT
VRYDNFISDHQVAVYRSRGRLPHWFIDQATYAITFRLIDSLPREVVIRLLEERERIISTARNASERAALEHAFSRRFDGYLDAGSGSCILREYGQIVADVLTHFDGVRFMLHAWCVMPNHVHVMFYVDRGLDVPNIVKGWKSTSAHYIDKGVIWQIEYFDRIVRSGLEFERERDYIRGNPTKAGLADWPWIG